MGEILVMNSEDRMTSLQIAEITGKPHNDVMKAIRKMEPAWVAVNEGNFSLVEYTDHKGENRPCYSLTQEECLYIATKFNDEARAKLIKRWKELEIEKRQSLPAVPQTFAQALMLAAKQQEEIERKQIQLNNQALQIADMTNEMASMQEKVSYVDKILQNKSTVVVTQIAQDYGMSAKHFNKILADDLQIQYKVNGQWILKAKYLSQGYVHSKSINIVRKNGSNGIVLNTEWTQKGRLFLYDELKKLNILPLIEQ